MSASEVETAFGQRKIPCFILALYSVSALSVCYGVFVGAIKMCDYKGVWYKNVIILRTQQ